MAEHFEQKLSFVEKAGYSAGDAAANFVFMTMILFQTNFYTDVFGISASAAATILIAARLWDAFADPVVGLIFAICTILLICYKLNKRMTLQMADELAERRKESVPGPTA